MANNSFSCLRSGMATNSFAVLYISMYLKKMEYGSRQIVSEIQHTTLYYFQDKLKVNKKIKMSKQNIYEMFFIINYFIKYTFTSEH